MSLIDIVPADCRHDAWTGAFYPDDLPEDWQLAYFSNEYGAALVPAARWLGQDPAVAGIWAEDVHDGFRIYLECPAEGADKLASWSKGLGSRFAGVVAEPSVAERLGRGLPCFVPVDTTTGHAAVASGHGLCFRTPPELAGDLRAQRRWLQMLTSVYSGHRLLLVIGDGSAEELRQWIDLAELMGLGGCPT